MMSLVLLTGKAGSGKDTVAGMLAEIGGVSIAQADPMKRLAFSCLGFTPNQLWGPSEERNKVDPRHPGDIAELWCRRQGLWRNWLQDIGLGDGTGGPAGDLHTWAEQYVFGQPTITPRAVLQTLGTEFGRRLDDQVWVKYAHRTARTILEKGLDYDPLKGPVKGPRSPRFVTITDGRFRNEVIAMKAAGGFVVNVTSPTETGLAGEAGKHASEAEQDSIPQSWYDVVLINDKSKGLEALQINVRYMTNTLLFPPPQVIGGMVS